MGEPIFAKIAVVIDEHGAAGQMGEHHAGKTSGDVELKCASGFQVLPVGNKNNAREARPDGFAESEP